MKFGNETYLPSESVSRNSSGSCIASWSPSSPHAETVHHHSYTCIGYRNIVPSMAHRQNHNHDPRSSSSTEAASNRPITRKMFIKSVIAVSSLCRASHRSSMCSVGEPFVAKNCTYLKNINNNIKAYKYQKRNFRD